MKYKKLVKLLFAVTLIVASMTYILASAAQRHEAFWAEKLEKKEEAIEANLVNKINDSTFKNFEIDKGAQDGLVEGDVVCTTDSLIGRLYQVNEGTSLVEFVTPKWGINYSLIAKERPENLDGVYEGMKGKMSSLFIFPKTKLDHGNIGDAVYTISSEESYPEGLFVGFVADHKLAEVPEGVWTVRLPVKPTDLETVYVYHVK